MLPSLRFACSLLVTAVASLAADSAPPIPQLVPGAPAPDFISQDLAGQSVRISDYRGKVLVVDFWATWCKNCFVMDETTFQDDAVKAARGNISEIQSR